MTDQEPTAGGPATGPAVPASALGPDDPGADPARWAAVAAAVELVEPGMTIGLGSGRAVLAACDILGARWGGTATIRAVVASGRTRARAIAAGLPLVDLDGGVVLDLAIDGADEVTRELYLVKGGGGALLREKLVIAAARRFVVVAETRKLVPRLGGTFRLPVEVVRFAWADTRRRLLDLLDDAVRRVTTEGQPVVTEEGHYLLDCAIPPEADVHALAARLKATVGVVEHGLFLDQASEAFLGAPDGTVMRLAHRAASPAGGPGPAGGRAGEARPSRRFDRIADRYDETRGGEARGRSVAADLSPYLDRDQLLLELGIGTGVVAGALRGLGYRVIGVDLSEPMLRRAVGRVGNVVALADAARLPLPDAAVAQAIAPWVLHVVGDLPGVLREAARVVAPGGRFVVIPVADEPVADEVGQLMTEMHERLDPGRPRHDHAAIVAAANAAGFDLTARVEGTPDHYDTSPAKLADQLEGRIHSILWDVPEEHWRTVVEPVITALRARPDADQPRDVALRRAILVFRRREHGSPMPGS